MVKNTSIKIKLRRGIKNRMIHGKVVFPMSCKRRAVTAAVAGKLASE